MTPLRVVIRLSQRWPRSLQGYEWLRESRMVGTSCHLNSFVAALPAAVARISVTRREGCYCWRQCFATYSAVYGANESYYLRLIHTTCIWCVRVHQTGWTLELFPLVRQCTILLHLHPHPHASNAHCVQIHTSCVWRMLLHFRREKIFYFSALHTSAAAARQTQLVSTSLYRDSKSRCS